MAVQDGGGSGHAQSSWHSILGGGGGGHGLFRMPRFPSLRARRQQRGEEMGVCDRRLVGGGVACGERREAVLCYFRFEPVVCPRRQIWGGAALGGIEPLVSVFVAGAR